MSLDSSYTPTIELSELVVGNIVRVTPLRHYGYEEEAGEQPWNAEVMAVDVEGDRVGVSQKSTNEPRWIERDRVTSNGQDVCLRFKDPRDGSWMRVVNSNPIAKAKQAKEHRDQKVRELLTMASEVRKVSYAKRDDLCSRMRAALLDLD